MLETPEEPPEEVCEGFRNESQEVGGELGTVQIKKQTNVERLRWKASDTEPDAVKTYESISAKAGCLQPPGKRQERHWLGRRSGGRSEGSGGHGSPLGLAGGSALQQRCLVPVAQD